MKEKLKNQIQYQKLLLKFYLNRDGKTKKAINTYMRNVLYKQRVMYSKKVPDDYLVYRLRNKYLFKTKFGESADISLIKFYLHIPLLILGLLLLTIPNIQNNNVLFFLLTVLVLAIFVFSFKHFFFAMFFPMDKSYLYYFAYNKLDNLLHNEKKLNDCFTSLTIKGQKYPDKKTINLNPSELQTLIAFPFNSGILNYKDDGYNIKKISDYIRDNFVLSNDKEIKSLEKRINEIIKKQRLHVDNPTKSIIEKMLQTTENPEKIINSLKITNKSH